MPDDPARSASIGEDHVWRGVYARLRAEGNAAGRIRESSESASRGEPVESVSRQLERLGLSKKSPPVGGPRPPPDEHSEGSEEAFFTVVWGNVVPRLERAPAA